MIATLMRSLPASHAGQDVALYELDPPLERGPRWDGDDRPIRRHGHVVVSRIAAAFDTQRPETYIFPASISAALSGENNLDKLITDWEELPGSASGNLTHAEALARVGYVVA